MPSGNPNCRDESVPEMRIYRPAVHGRAETCSRLCSAVAEFDSKFGKGAQGVCFNLPSYTAV